MIFPTEVEGSKAKDWHSRFQKDLEDALWMIKNFADLVSPMPGRVSNKRSAILALSTLGLLLNSLSPVTTRPSDLEIWAAIQGRVPMAKPISGGEKTEVSGEKGGSKSLFIPPHQEPAPTPTPVPSWQQLKEKSGGFSLDTPTGRKDIDGSEITYEELNAALNAHTQSGRMASVPDSPGATPTVPTQAYYERKKSSSGITVANQFDINAAYDSWARTDELGRIRDGGSLDRNQVAVFVPVTKYQIAKMEVGEKYPLQGEGIDPITGQRVNLQKLGTSEFKVVAKDDRPESWGSVTIETEKGDRILCYAGNFQTSAFTPSSEIQIVSSPQGDFLVAKHQVQAGDTKEKIAQHYGLSGKDLGRRNPDFEPKEGETVYLRISGPQLKDERSKVAAWVQRKKDQLPQPTPEGVAMVSGGPLPPGSGSKPEGDLSAPSHEAELTRRWQQERQKTGEETIKIYERATYPSVMVQKGETLLSMARKFGVRPSQIVKANNLTSPLKEGQLIDIPSVSGVFVPAHEDFIPSGSILLRAADRANLGIAFLNENFYSSWPDLEVPLIKPNEEVHFIPLAQDGENINWGSAGKSDIELYIPDVAELAWVNDGSNRILVVDHSRLPSRSQQYLIWKVIHESVHRGQIKFGLLYEYLGNDPYLEGALESCTEYITLRAADAYEENKIGWPSQRAHVKKGIFLVDRLNKAGLKGEEIIFYYGGKGDMKTLEDVYDSVLGKDAFRKDLEDLIQ